MIPLNSIDVLKRVKVDFENLANYRRGEYAINIIHEDRGEKKDVRVKVSV